MDTTRTQLSGSHRDRVVVAAIELVNALAPGSAHGHQFVPELSPTDVAAAANAAFNGFSDSQADFSPAYARETLALAASLQRIFLALAAGEVTGAVPLLNAMLREHPSALHLSQDEPWSLHYHDHTLPAHAGWSTGCAAALSSFISSGHWNYLGSCHAVACDRIFLDVTRNTSRRFCSVRCQNREKVRAYRQRLS
ncbi:CGNR zinc finger domain-containing protein [Mycetocola zhadangensis]|uniref:CGNR zinc finger domain-containing protein n=1 Tax=Mycetocola zhadangensis TaxID=1164595 RepID=UPI003A4DA713